MAAGTRPRETRRKKEIGTTLFTYELDTVQRAALSRNAKLATYVRDAVLEIANRDLAAAEAESSPPPPPALDRADLIREVAAEVVRMIAGAVGEQKKGSAEDSP